MKEKTKLSRSNQSFLVTEDEISVAEILIDLPSMIWRLESRYSLKWGSKKRRSRFTDSPQSQTKAAAKEEVSASASPVTPLAFSASESDGKYTHGFEKRSTKRSREKYSGMIQELSERRDLLRKEIGNVTKYYNNLIAYNSELKEILKCCQKKEVGISSVGDNGINLGESQPLDTDQFGSNGIPDLNICAEETFGVDQCQPLDLSLRRATFAEARRRRMVIIKIKSIKLGRQR